MRLAFLLTTTAFCGALASAATAQESTDDLRKTEIIVTAQKKEQIITDVPINISVADQDYINLINADDYSEYADFVPGLQIQEQSLNAPSYSLRGVTSDGGRPRVAVFQNGVAVGNLRFGANTAIFDIERIEVVKGPQATLFGQGALVGGVNILHNRASTAGNEGYARIDVGSDNYIRSEMGYNFAVNDKLALRFAGLVKNRDGYVPNLGNSPDLMGQDTNAVRGVVFVQPTPALSADLFVNYQQDDSTGTQFKSSVFAPAGGDLSPYSATAMNINEDQLRDKLGNDREIFSVTANVEYEINDAWTLTSITDYRDLDSLEAFDSDGAAFDLLQFGLHDKGQAFSQELRFNFDDGGPITAFFGANYYDEDTSQRLRFSTDEARLQALFAPVIAGAAGLTVSQLEGFLALGGVPGATNFDNVLNPLQFSALGALQGNLVPLHGDHLEEQTAGTETTAIDFFGDVTVDINDRLALTAGLRYTQEDISADALAYLVRGNPALGGQANAIFFNTTILVNDDLGVPRARSFEAGEALTWRLNAAYRINDDLNSWVAIGRGRRPEALSANSDEPTGFEVVLEEVFDNIEVGLAGYAWDGRVRFTTSAYYGQYKDFQTTRFEPAVGTFITENSGNATQYGAEIDSQILVNDYIEVFATYAYNFSQYDDEDDSGNRLEFAGNQFRLSPENSFSIGADMRYPAFNAGEVYFAPTYVWKDDHFFDDDNAPLESQEAYGLLDLKLGFEHKSGVWGASIYLENALDEEYLIDAGNTGGSFGIPTFIRGVPQQAGAGLYVKF